MKQARQVTIKEPLSKNQVDELLEHAQNSATWYCEASSKTSSMIASKLKDKGYPNRLVDIDDGTQINFIEEAIEYCKSRYLLTEDLDYAKTIVKQESRRGKSLPEIRIKLHQKALSKETIHEALENYSSDEALEKAIAKAERSSSVRKAESSQKERKLIEALLRKGFKYSDISQVLQS